MRDVQSGSALTRIVDIFEGTVPTVVATLHEFARHNSHKADDFPALLWDSKARIRVIYEFRQWYKLDGGAVVKESYYAMKGGSLQIRREGNDANEHNFLGGRAPECLGVATAHDLYRTIGNIIQ